MAFLFIKYFVDVNIILFTESYTLLSLLAFPLRYLSNSP